MGKRIARAVLGGLVLLLGACGAGDFSYRGSPDLEVLRGGNTVERASAGSWIAVEGLDARLVWEGLADTGEVRLYAPGKKEAIFIREAGLRDVTGFTSAWEQEGFLYATGETRTPLSVLVQVRLRNGLVDFHMGTGFSADGQGNVCTLLDPLPGNGRREVTVLVNHDGAGKIAVSAPCTVISVPGGFRITAGTDSWLVAPGSGKTWQVLF